MYALKGLKQLIMRYLCIYIFMCFSVYITVHKINKIIKRKIKTVVDSCQLLEIAKKSIRKLKQKTR